MTLELDPQIAAALAPLLEQAGDMTPAPAGDVAARRAALDPFLVVTNQLEDAATDVTVTDHQMSTSDGDTVLLRWYRKDGAEPGSAVAYFHGGGMILGSVTAWDGPVSHSSELGVDPARIAVMGNSAGGGLAAGVSILSRDRNGPAVAQQLLIFPMLDDRLPRAEPVTTAVLPIRSVMRFGPL